MPEFKKCINCGNECIDTSKFCPKCGYDFSIEIKETEEPKQDNKKYLNVSTIVFLSIAGLMILLSLLFLVVIPLFTNTNTTENIIIMPDIIGLDIDEAERCLKNNNITNIKIVEEYTTEYGENRVCDVSIKPGSEYKEGKLLTITVVKFKEECDYKVLKTKELITVRSSPHKLSDGSNYVGKVSKNNEFIIYETHSDSNYQWYRIGTNKWIANDGTWVDVNRDENKYEAIKQALYMIQITENGNKLPIYKNTKGSKYSTKLSRLEIYLVYEVQNKNGKTWYRIGDNKWICCGSDQVDIIETY